jgi:hypothetical protein
MAWKFDAVLEDIVWVETTDTVSISGNLDFGTAMDSDLALDTGLRTNDTSIIDLGQRI